jgi:hypothetical protein
MAKLALRFLILSMFTTSLLVTPIVTQVQAATTNGKHLKKKRVSVVHRSPRGAGPSASPFPTNYDDDFDRKNAGGAGGY